MPIVRHGRMMYPDYGLINYAQTNFGAQTMNATGHKTAFIGRVWSKDRTSKSIRKVGFRFGAVTKAGGSGLTLSLQDVSTTAGPPYQPDGVQDQTFAITNGNALFASNTWFLSGNLSADRSVTHGERIAVVVEFDGSGRLGADSVVMNYHSASTNDHSHGVMAFSGSWTALSGPGIVLFEFSDGTIGTLAGSLAISSAYGANAYNTSTAVADEFAIEFTIPFDCEVEGAGFPATIASGADFSVVLTNAADSVVASVALDANAITNNSLNFVSVWWPPVNITKDSIYRLALRPATTNNVTFPSRQVSSASHLDTFPGGQAFRMAKRLDGGSWTSLTTEASLGGLWISGVEIPNPVGGASMARIHLGM